MALIVEYTTTHPDYPSGTITFENSDTGAALRNWIENTIEDGFYYSQYRVLTLSLSGILNGTTASLFSSCRELISVDFSECDTSSATSTSWMFGSCYALANVDFTNCDFSNVTDMSYMFDECKALTEMSMAGWNIPNVTIMDGMFQYCSNLISVDMMNIKADSLYGIAWMFSQCPSLTTIYCEQDWSSKSRNFDTFSDCTSLVGAISYSSSKKSGTYANPTTGYFTIGLPVVVNGIRLSRMYLNSTQIQTLFFNGIQIFPEEIPMTFAQCEAFVQAAFGGTSNIRSGYSLHLYDMQTTDPRTGETCYHGVISNSSTTESIIFLYVNLKPSLGITYELGSWYDIDAVVNDTSLVDYSKLHEL